MDSTVLENILNITPLGVVVSITIALVQLVKFADDANKYSRFYPLLSFVIGMVVGVTVFHLDLATNLVTALAASGMYDLAKRTVLGIPSSVPVVEDPVDEPTSSTNAMTYTSTPVASPPVEAAPTEPTVPTDPSLPAPPPMGTLAEVNHPVIK